LTVELTIFEPFFNKLSEEIVFIDRNFKITHANSEFCKYYNLPKEKVIGKYCYNIIHKVDTPCSFQDNVCPLVHVLKTKNTYRSLHKHINGGKHILKDQFSTPYKTKNGEILGILMLTKNTEIFFEAKESKEAVEKGSEFEDLPQIDKDFLDKQQVKELLKDIQNTTELCLFFLKKKTLNLEDIVSLWKEVYNQTQFGVDLLSNK